MERGPEGEADWSLFSVGPLQSRNVVVNSRRTSMRLEPTMWDALEDIAEREGISVNMICSMLEARLKEQEQEREEEEGAEAPSAAPSQAPSENLGDKDAKKLEISLTSAVRVFIAAYFRNAATEEGHAKAGHGQQKLARMMGLRTVVKPSEPDDPSPRRKKRTGGGRRDGPWTAKEPAAFSSPGSARSPVEYAHPDA